MTRTFTIQRTEVDGIPTFWADTPPGPFVAMLTFRAGRADEPPPAGGISHLVEHLALAPFADGATEHNGAVDALRTTFVVIGEPEDAVSFMGRLADSLADLPFDRLLTERRILLREQDQSGAGIGGAVRWFRYGLRGHGLTGQDDVGLTWLGPEPVRQWAEERYNRSNAALILSGPPPAGLRIPLRDGRRADPVALEPIKDVVLPSHVSWDGPGVTLAMVVPRKPPSNMLLNICQRRARQALRHERGLVYDVLPDYEPLDSGTAHAVLGVDVTDEQVPSVARALVEVLDRLADEGPTADELRIEVDGFRRQFADRDAQIGFLDVAALDHLLGDRFREPDAILEGREGVTPDAARATMREALETAILVAGGDGLPAGRFHRYPAASADSVGGREFKPSGFHLPGRGPKERLFLAPDGVSVRLEAGDWATVRFADCVVAEHLGDNIRIVWSADGHRVAVAGSDWRDGQVVVDAIDRALPATVVACPEHGIGGLDFPADSMAPGA